MATPSWISRATGAVAYFARAALSRIPSLRRAPARAGISSGRVVTNFLAERDLSSLAASPTVYAAVLRRALGLTVYPIRMLSGFSIGGQRPDPIDPKRTPWAASFLRLLQTPNPLDLEGLFPSDPGEGLLSQLIVDLLLSGNAYVAVQMNAGGDIIGLYRLHPQLVTLVRAGGQEFWEHRGASGGDIIRYPRRTVAHLKLPSWQSSGAGELGTGAGTPLYPLVRAEKTALDQTASVIEQGGADVMVTGRTPAGAAFLAVDTNRKAIVEQITTALAGGVAGVRRVFALGGDLEVKDAGLKPAELKAPELLAAAGKAEMMAIGVVPVALGGDGGTYASAALQHRVQAELDEQLCAVIEAGFLRPLARRFATRAGGRWAARADEVTARFDLASHPGYTYVRTDAITRAKTLFEMGWTAEQAAEAEGLDLPKPEGTAAVPAGPQPATPGTPRRPLGDTGSASKDAPADAPPRTVGQLLARSAEPATAAEEDPAGMERAAAWQRAEAGRERSDRDLKRAVDGVLAAERDAYVEAAIRELEKAERTARALVRAPAGDGGTPYTAIDMDTILGDLQAAVDRWTAGLTPDWLATWEEGAATALDGTGVEGVVRVPRPVPADLQKIEETAAQAADYSRERVRLVVEQGMDEGAPVAEIAVRLREDQAFNDARALRIARTETVRAQSSGTNARYDAAVEDGVEMEQEWLTARFNVRDHHRALDGVIVEIGGLWTFPGGVKTPGPGLSGDASEDINCRCGRRPRVKGR